MRRIHFYGTFDGGGHKISNLTINSKEEYQGLFGYNIGTIKNVKIESGSLNVVANSGGVVGLNKGLIDSCYNKASISSNESTSDFIGGICGLLEYGGTIRKCCNKGNITYEESGYMAHFGGVSGGARPDANIIDCYNSGNIICKSSVQWVNVGGIVGGGGFIRNCYNSGSVTYNFLQGTLNRNHNIGGITSGFENNTSKLSNCVNLGVVFATGGLACDGSRIGAIAGVIQNSSSYDKCYWKAGSYNCGIGLIKDSSSDATIAMQEINSAKLVEILGENWKQDTAYEFPILIWE